MSKLIRILVITGFLIMPLVFSPEMVLGDASTTADMQASDVQASDVQASDMQASDMQASDVQASDMQADDVQADDTQLAAEVASVVAIDPLTLVWQDLQPSYNQSTLLPTQGRAMYYNPNIFEQVLDFRLRANHVTECDECIGYVAMLRRGDLDRRVWLRREGKPAEGPFWVIDVAAKHHVGLLLERGWTVDVDYDTAMRWRMNRPIPVTVLENPTPAEFESSLSLDLNWNAVSVPAENFNWPPASLDPYHGAVDLLQ